MSGKHPDIRKNLLPVLLLLNGAASLIHHAHNAEFLADYPNMPAGLSPVMVYGVWLGLTAVALAGYALIRRGYQLAGLAVLSIYGALGLGGLGHYAVAPLSAHTFTMNMTIWLETATAVLLLTTVVSLMLKHLRT